LEKKKEKVSVLVKMLKMLVASIISQIYVNYWCWVTCFFWENIRDDYEWIVRIMHLKLKCIVHIIVLNDGFQSFESIN